MLVYSACSDIATDIDHVSCTELESGFEVTGAWLEKWL